MAQLRRDQHLSQRDVADYLGVTLATVKNRAEYDPTPTSAGEARDAHKAAERIVAIAERVGASLQSD